MIERRAGVKAAYIDSAYEQVGAKFADDAYTGSQMILKVRAPQGAEISKSLRQIHRLLQCLTRIVTLSLISLHQTRVCICIGAYCHVLYPVRRTWTCSSSQANLSGYKSVLLAAAEYQRMFPMFMTAAGTVNLHRVVIMGVGVAGLQAIATAKRLGAVVEATDLRPTATRSGGITWAVNG